MNFLDTYDIPGQTTPTQEPQQSLNEESQSVLQTARKDFSEVVTQAQKELTKLTSEPTAAASTSTTEPTNPEGDASSPPATGNAEADGDSSQPSTSTQEETASTTISTTPTSLLSRLQSALPPNLLETARNQLPESLKHASENIDIPQLRANFVSEFQRVQGVTRAQAEEYAHKSEALLREAVKEAGEVLRDAVKILPPEEEARNGASGLVWDGSDMWSLPLEPSDAASSSNPSTSQATPQRRNVDTQDAVTTRAESLFRRLKQDPAIIRHDPAVDGGELYSMWLAAEVTPKEGGIEGEHWSAKVSALLDQPGSELKATRDTLVPSELTEAEFWMRFFFRAHQIEVEEQKRKSLLEGTLEEEDFSWEDDDEAAPSEVLSTSASVITSSAAESLTNEKLAQVADNSQNLSTTLSTIARDSGEDYDVVSLGNVSPRVVSKPLAPSETKDNTSDADSDWE
ncbi:hypothetical protein D9615_004539 [Tricholomella constricta]|uniref:BSD domain-containing protein n=1 Tax=Tricholomella constricta TaxID=117010 RepID=A0A8H5HBZ3_9AGAR|nr:hypothetical protein D9615_004539 [Tricholomella constricta]